MFRTYPEFFLFSVTCYQPNSILRQQVNRFKRYITIATCTKKSDTNKPAMTSLYYNLKWSLKQFPN